MSVTATTFTDQEKLAEIDRELQQRFRVYKWLVRKGKLSPEQARRQTDILLSIRAEYYGRVSAAPGPLFSHAG